MNSLSFERLFTDLCATLPAFALFPLIFAAARKGREEEKRYRRLCLGVNVGVFLLLFLRMGTMVSGGACILGTALFTELGLKILNAAPRAAGAVDVPVPVPIPVSVPPSGGTPEPPAHVLRSPVVEAHGAAEGTWLLPPTGEALAIGRSPDCELLYPPNTPGVSSHHCTVRWDGSSGEFIVLDTGSTYGTYLESGMELEKNTDYRLPPGSRLWLGQPKNIIILKVE